MNEKLKGGIETIIAIIIVTALVIVLIISVIVPMATRTNALGSQGVSDISALGSMMGYDEP